MAYLLVIGLIVKHVVKVEVMLLNVLCEINLVPVRIYELNNIIKAMISKMV